MNPLCKKANISHLQLNDFLWLCCHKQNNETFDLISSFRYFDLMSSCHLYICLITQKNTYKSMYTVVFNLEVTDLYKTKKL